MQKPVSTIEKIESSSIPQEESLQVQEEAIEIKPENFVSELYHEKWPRRKNAYAYLKSTFDKSEPDQPVIDFFNARAIEMLTEKNFFALEDLLSALQSYLKNCDVSRFFIQSIATFFSSNIPNKKNEKQTIDIICICADLNQEVAFAVICKRFDVENQYLQQIHLLNIVFFLLQNKEITIPSIIKNLLLKLKPLLSNPNQKVRKLAIENIKETIRFLKDDYISLKKMFFEGIKDIQIKEIQFAFMEEKKQNAFWLSESSHTNLSNAEKEPGFSQNYGNNQSRANLSNTNQEASQRKLKNPESQEIDDLESEFQIKHKKSYKIEPPKEPTVPEKLMDIVNVKTIEEKIEVLQGFKNQLALSKYFSIQFPNKLFPLLTSELKESNFLLYSIVIEVLALIFKRSKSKQSIHQGLAKQLIQISASKYNIKPGMNLFIFDVIDSFAKKEYISADIIVKFMLDEINVSKAKNTKLCFLDWFAQKYPLALHFNSFKEFNRKIKMSREAKIYLQKFNEDFKNSAQFVFKEAIGFVLHRFYKIIEEEKQNQNKTLIRESIAKLREKAPAYINGKHQIQHSEDELSDSEIEKQKLVKKLNGILNQLNSSDTAQICAGKELYINSIYQTIEQFDKLDTPTSCRILKAIEKLQNAHARLTAKNAIELIVIFSILFDEDSIKGIPSIFYAIFDALGFQKFIEILLFLFQRSSMRRNYLKMNQSFADVLNKVLDSQDEEEVRLTIGNFKSNNSSSKRYITFLTPIINTQFKNDNFRENSAKVNKKTFPSKSLSQLENVEVSNTQLPKINANQKANEEVVSTKNPQKTLVDNCLPKIDQKPVEYNSLKEVHDENEAGKEPDYLKSIDKSREHLYSQLDEIVSIFTLKTFLAKTGNNFGLLNNLRSKVTFKEICGYFDRIFELISASKNNCVQILSGFTVLAFSLLNEKDKDKFFVLILTYFTKFKFNYEEILAPLFTQSQKAFCCYKYAFNMVSKQSDNAGKCLMLGNTLSFFINQVRSERRNLKNSQFVMFLEIIISGIEFEAFPAFSDGFIEDCRKSLISVSKDILEQIFESSEPGEIQMKFEKELAHSGKLYNIFCLKYSEFVNRKKKSEMIRIVEQSHEETLENSEMLQSVPVSIVERQFVEEQITSSRNQLTHDSRRNSSSNFKQNPQENMEEVGQTINSVSDENSEENFDDDPKIQPNVCENQTRFKTDENILQNQQSVSNYSNQKSSFKNEACSLEFHDKKSMISQEKNEPKNYLQNKNEESGTLSNYKDIRAQRKFKINSVDPRGKSNVSRHINFAKMTSLESINRNDENAHHAAGHQESVFGFCSEPKIPVEKPNKNSKLNIPKKMDFQTWKNSLQQTDSFSKKMDKTTQEIKSPYQLEKVEQKKGFTSEMPQMQHATDIQNTNNSESYQYEIHTKTQTENVKKDDKYVNNIFEMKKIEKKQSEDQIQTTISTQTDFEIYGERDKIKLSNKISELTERNAQITHQLYFLSQSNDELKEENKSLQTKLTYSNQSSFPEDSNFRELNLENFSQNFAEAILQNENLLKNNISQIYQNFQQKSIEEKEKMLFDFKFYLIDPGMIEFISFENFSGLLHFIIKVSLSQNMNESEKNSGIIKLVHTILDIILKAPGKSFLLTILLHLIREHIPQFQTGFNEEETLYIKLLLKISSKVVELSKKEVTKTGEFGKNSTKSILFKILTEIFLIFKKTPPETLSEDTLNLSIYDETFKDIKKIGDEIAILDLSVTKQFLKMYKIQHADKMFIQYLSNFIKKHDN